MIAPAIVVTTAKRPSTAWKPSQAPTSAPPTAPAKPVACVWVDQPLRTQAK